MRDRHASWEEILAFLESTDSADSTVRPHLTSCKRCAQLAEEARAILGLLAEARLPVPPSALVERTLARLRASLEEATTVAAQPAALGSRELLKRLRSTFREVWGTLVADSLLPAPALRGSSVAPPRLVRYETPEYIVTLSLAPGSARQTRDVQGQLVPRRGEAVPSGACAAAAHGEQMIEAHIGATGEFRLSNVPASSDEVGILVGDDWIRLRLPE